MSGDYGMRISKDTKDAGTCTDLETLMTSKYPFFKGSTMISGSVVLTNAQTANITIVHNLGYNPFYQAKCNGYAGQDGGHFISIPGSEYSPGSGGMGMQCSATADANNIYLTITQMDGFGPMGTHTYNYIVFIYKDKV